MKKPLNKRLIRELTGDIGKYIVIFILLVFSIGFVSGFLVAGESMIKAYNESFEKYNIEDGNFRTEEKITARQIERIEKNGVSVFENRLAKPSTVYARSAMAVIWPRARWFKSVRLSV